MDRESLEKIIKRIQKAWLFLTGRSRSFKAQGYYVASAGILQGGACWLVAAFFSYFFGEKTAIASTTMVSHIPFGVSLVAAIIITGLLAFADRGTGIGALSWLGEFTAKWQEENSEESHLSRHYAVLFFNGVLICKVLCLAALIGQGHSFWLLYAGAFAATTFAAAAIKSEELAHEYGSEIEIFTTVTVFALVSCIFHRHLIPVILCMVIVYGVYHFTLHFFLNKFGQINTEVNRALSEVIYCVSLIAGLLFIN